MSWPEVRAAGAQRGIGASMLHAARRAPRRRCRSLHEACCESLAQAGTDRQESTAGPIRPRKGGQGLSYAVPMSVMPKLMEINSLMQDPLARYNAVMALPDLFTVEPLR